jgi:hypothetical protein
MRTFNYLLIISFCLLTSVVFGQGSADKSAAALKGINVYFPGSEVKGDKLNLNVQGRIVAVPLCHADIAKVDDHNFSFTANDKSDKIMRGDEPATQVKLQLVHSTNDKLVGLLQDLKAAVCGK